MTFGWQSGWKEDHGRVWVLRYFGTASETALRNLAGGEKNMALPESTAILYVHVIWIVQSYAVLIGFLPLATVQFLRANRGKNV